MIIPLKSRYLQLNEEEFFNFCQEMKDFRLERDAQGTILIMSPTGSKSGNLNGEVATEVFLWNRKTKPGLAFDSSTGFTLPNQAVRSPDVSWIAQKRWEALSEQDRERFAPITPDFVIEIRSTTDHLQILQEKMTEYIQQGVQLGWLIDLLEENVWIYKPEGTIEKVESFDVLLSGEEVLEGFELRVSDFWEK